MTVLKNQDIRSIKDETTAQDKKTISYILVDCAPLNLTRSVLRITVVFDFVHRPEF
jgi:hypothetical protein